VKNYLKTRGVEFDAINALTEPGARVELDALGARGFPVITRGGRFVIGVERDFERLDELLYLQHRSGGRLIPGSELVERACGLLITAMRYAHQLPSAHYDDLIPGMEDDHKETFTLDGHVLVADDGKPYVPHRTSIGLVRHIFGHGFKFRLEVEHPETDFSHIGIYAQTGEPGEGPSIAELDARTQVIVADIRRWWQSASPEDLARPMRSFVAGETLHLMLQREVYSLTQHTRQLMTVLENLGIEPHRRLGEADFEGLQLPEGVWK
jgi:glutaredoxin